MISLRVTCNSDTIGHGASDKQWVLAVYWGLRGEVERQGVKRGVLGERGTWLGQKEKEVAGAVSVCSRKRGYPWLLGACSGHGKGLGWSRIVHDPVELTTDPSAFSCDLYACLLLQRHHEPNEFKGCKQSIVILVVNKDVVIRREKLLADTGQGLLVELLTSPMQQVDLKEVIGQHDKDHLIDDHGERARGKVGQVAETLELPISLLGGDTQVVLLLGQVRLLHLPGVD